MFPDESKATYVWLPFERDPRTKTWSFTWHDEWTVGPAAEGAAAAAAAQWTLAAGQTAPPRLKTDDAPAALEPYPVLWDSNSIAPAALAAAGILPNARKVSTRILGKTMRDAVRNKEW